MRNRYKILSEKYSLVNEDDREDIMTGLGELEKLNTLVYAGYTDPDDIGLDWQKNTIEGILEEIVGMEGEIEGHAAEDMSPEDLYNRLASEDIVNATGHGDYGMVLFALSFNKQSLEDYALRCIGLQRLRAL